VTRYQSDTKEFLSKWEEKSREIIHDFLGAFDKQRWIKLSLPGSGGSSPTDLKTQLDGEASLTYAKKRGVSESSGTPDHNTKRAKFN
jgi:hypothetical protein